MIYICLVREVDDLQANTQFIVMISLISLRVVFLFSKISSVPWMYVRNRCDTRIIAPKPTAMYNVKINVNRKSSPKPRSISTTRSRLEITQLDNNQGHLDDKQT